jgi:transposase
VGRIGIALQPSTVRLAELLKYGQALYADETPVPLLDFGNRKTKRAYLWAYSNDVLEDKPVIIVLDFQSGRGGSHVQAILNNWQGNLIMNDYTGYKVLFALGIIELACVTLARRKFCDLYAANSHPVAAEALTPIVNLFAL